MRVIWMSNSNKPGVVTTRWWWVRHAPVPDGGFIYGQRDLDCDCGLEASGLEPVVQPACA